MDRHQACCLRILVLIALAGIAIGLNRNAPALADGPQDVKDQNEPQTLLFVQTKPAGAEVRLEGKVLGESDGLFPVDAGNYKIVIDLSGHEPREQQITIREGRITRIELTLEKSSETVSAAPASEEDYPENDKVLSEPQRLYRDWTQANMAAVLASAEASELNEADREKREGEWISQLATLPGRARIPAINSLVEIGSSKATAALLEIAANRKEGDNRDRWIAVRALGLIGDRSAVPDLVHLTYHYNQNTRFWAQISLVRLTGKDFGRDMDAWRNWWKEQGGKPEISKERIEWTKNPEWADPAKQEESDRAFVEMAKARKQGKEAGQFGPPHVVATHPASGAIDVDPNLESITVIFDQDMGDGFSFTGGGPDYPTIPEGQGPAWKDRRTCVLPVQLEKGHYYRVGINSTSFQNFRSAAGMPVPPSAIYFTTEGASEELRNQVRIPKIVSITPANGAADVDPSITEIRVVFDLPMGEGFSWTGGGPTFPQVPEGKKPFWTDDGKSCVLPVQLKPSWNYSVGLNSVSHKNFQSKWGVPMKPVPYSFSTRAK